MALKEPPESEFVSENSNVANGPGQRIVMVTETLWVETKLQACMGGESAFILVSLAGESFADLVIEHTVYGKRKTDKKAILPTDARRIIDQFLDVLGTRQCLMGTESTTVFTCRVTWTVGGTKNEWSAESNDARIQSVKGIMASGLDEQSKQMILLKRAAYFNLAQEIHRAAMAVVKEHEI